MCRALFSFQNLNQKTTSEKGVPVKQSLLVERLSFFNFQETISRKYNSIVYFNKPVKTGEKILIAKEKAVQQLQLDGRNKKNASTPHALPYAEGSYQTSLERLNSYMTLQQKIKK